MTAHTNVRAKHSHYKVPKCPIAIIRLRLAAEPGEVTWLRGPQPLNKCCHLPEFLNPLPLSWDILIKCQLQSWIVGSCAIGEVHWQG